MVDIYTLSVIIFFAILATLIYKNRKTLEIQYYVAIMKRTEKGKKIIDRLAKLSPKTWKFLSTLGIVVCIFFIGFGIFILALTAKSISEKTLKTPALQFILPIPVQQPVSGLGFIGIPFWFWIIVIAFVIFPHELAHGIISRVEKIKIKSVGLILFLIFPGAFVEPDEREIKKAKLLSKLRIFCAGSAANFATVFVLGSITSLLIWPAFVNPGLLIISVNETAPAGSIGLKENSVLQKIGDKELKADFGLFSQIYGGSLIFLNNTSEDFISNFSSGVLVMSALEKYKPNDTITLRVNNMDYNLTLASHPLNSSWPYIGISTKLNVAENSESMLSIVFPLIWWMTTLGFAVALINILPIYPLDGGLVLESLAKKVSKKHHKIIISLVSVFVLSLIVFNFIGPWLLALSLFF